MRNYLYAFIHDTKHTRILFLIKLANTHIEFQDHVFIDEKLSRHAILGVEVEDDKKGPSLMTFLVRKHSLRI